MFAEVQINEFKPRAICVANEALVNGAPVDYSAATRKLAKAAGKSHYVVTNAKNYDGINAVKEPTDAEHETIASGALCIRVPLELGDIFATTEVTTTNLSAGDPECLSAFGCHDGGSLLSYAGIRKKAQETRWPAPLAFS